MLQQPDEAPDEASFHRYTVDLPQAMIGRVDALADEAGRLMKCDVTRATLFRAAFLFWLARREATSPKYIIQEIHEAAPLEHTLLQRTKPGWSNELNERLLALSARLDVKISHSAAGVRSALLLAALRFWLSPTEDDPRKAFDTIRAGLVKRGRKPKR